VGIGTVERCLGSRHRFGGNVIGQCSGQVVLIGGQRTGFKDNFGLAVEYPVCFVGVALVPSLYTWAQSAMGGQKL
jgi:hypothetical protein